MRSDPRAFTRPYPVWFAPSLQKVIVPALGVVGPVILTDRRSQRRGLAKYGRID